MAFVDVTPVYRPVQVSVARVFHSVAKWIAARQEARVNKDSLQHLLLAPDYLLDDIGVTREQLTPMIETLSRQAQPSWPQLAAGMHHAGHGE
jgi:uncharacterized protein YjiS (DUF1127 family)